MSIMKFVKIKNENGTVTDTIPIGADAVNVSLNDGRSVEQAILDLMDASDLAPSFNVNSTYAVGDYVSYNHTLYKITSAHAAGVAWNNTSKTAVYLATELKSSGGSGSSANIDTTNLVLIEDIAPIFNANSVYAAGDYVYYNNHLYRFIQKHNAGVSWNAATVERMYLTVGVNDSIQKIYDSIDDIIEVKSTQPQETINKLWIDNTVNNQIPIATYAELVALKNQTSKITINTDSHELKISTIQ